MKNMFARDLSTRKSYLLGFSKDVNNLSDTENIRNEFKRFIRKSLK